MKILELIENAINHKSITGGRCFTCGGEPSRGLGEHVIPKWLLTQLSLWDSKLTLINGTRLPYRQLRVPCCEKCNNEFMSQIEDRAKAVFTAQQVRDGDDVLNLGRWMSKILVGILTVETRLLIDRQNPSKGFILDAKFLDNFHLCHLILQTARKQTSFSCLHSDYPFSLYWYIVDGAEASDFDFITDIWGNAVAIQIGRLGVVFVADGGLQMEVGEKGPYDLSGSVVSIAKFRELVIRIFYKSQLRDATHFYINSEMPDTMSVNQSHVTPYTGMIPGTEMIQIFRDWNEDEIRSVLAMCLVMRLIWAMSSQLSADWMDFSQSLASLRHLLSHAKVRSTTHRLGMTSKPLALSVRLTISMVQQPFFSRMPRSFGP